MTEWLERARAVRIEDEIRRRVLKLEESGKHWLVGPCPLCGGDDRFTVSLRKQYFYCRGCKITGDVIDLVELLDGCDTATAAAAARRRASAVGTAATPGPAGRG